MGRQKKNLSLQIEKKPEVVMSETQVLESLETEIDKTRAELEKTKKELEEKKSQLKTMPAREVTEEEMIIVKKQVSMSSERSALKEKIEKQRAYDNVLVTGKFINRRAPGQGIKLPYQKHVGDSEKLWEFEDGQVCTIPRGFADQLNGGSENDPCHYTPVFINKQGEHVHSSKLGKNSSIAAVDTSNKKYAFVPVNF
jgi:predicted RNase H-like nuclease (RuvC/YqgF family)